MKILGFGCGRRMGNCEILLKEALMGAEEKGASVELVRMADLDIKNCLWCAKCKWLEDGPEACVIKDDAPWFYDKFMDSDGLIIAAPIYTLTPPGQLITIRDRIMGPKTDVAGKIEFGKMKLRINTFTDKTPEPDPRTFKPRCGGLISLGGAPLANWVPFGLPILHTVTFTPQIAIADQMQVLKAGEPYSILLFDEVIKRARKLGQNVAEALGKPFAEVKFKGDDPGACPVCHTRLMVIGNKNPIECAVCGIQGNLTVDSAGKIKVVFSEEEQKKSRLELEGKRIHFYEIFETSKEFWAKKDEVMPKADKYKSYMTPLKSPSRSKKSE